MKIALKMTGCKNNRYELDRILRWAIDSGVPVVREDEADFCVINTCTVTRTADRKSRQMVRRTKNSNSRLKTIVFGCGARVQKKDFNNMEETDYLLSDVESVIGFLEKQFRKCGTDAVPAVKTRSRALVQIQDGCDNFCSYCVIALARGRSKSRPQAEIINEINERTAEGYNEIVLTGINIGAYGASSTKKPEESGLADLLDEILDKTDVKRIRLSSLGPEYFSGRLFDVLKNPRICRHIHLSIQSGSDTVLKRMMRNYDIKKTEKIIKNLKKNIPGIAVTTDIIVGFPEESDKEFMETMDFAGRNRFAKIHVFPYSVRQGTPAAGMKQIPDKIKKERSASLQKLADKCRDEFINGQIGKKVSVLWDNKGKGVTDNYIRVNIKTPHQVRHITIEQLAENMVIRD
jgi:threonylcarbamoyladenosine tRNA methylthiotransferase MtaB